MAGKLQVYAQLVIAIDGRIQLQEQKLALSHGVSSPMEVEFTSAIPSEGFEFDAKPHLGTDKTFQVAIYRQGTPTSAAGASSHRYPDWDKPIADLVSEGYLTLAVDFEAKVVGWRLNGDVGREAQTVTVFREVGEEASFE